VNSREDRERYLEERMPPLHRQLEFRADWVRLARRVCNLKGVARRRSVQRENLLRQLAIRARAGQPIEWPDD
jgi:hypothetical protein